MNRASWTLAPAVPDLAALGATGVEDLLGTGTGLLEEPRSQILEREDGAVLLRCPLPGTPAGDGRLTAAPRGAGTGWMRVRRYERPPLSELLRARFSAPPSASAAEREWNLICHLRAKGVSTPELLAVASGPAHVWSRRSALVTRELEDVQDLETWLRVTREPRARRRGLLALGHFVARLEDARVELPRLGLSQLFITCAPDACAAETIQLLRAGAGTRLRATPDVVVGCVRGGRLLPRPTPQVQRRLLARLAREAFAAGVADERDALRVARAALRRQAPSDRRRRRAWLSDLARESLPNQQPLRAKRLARKP